ncbi:MAG: hypothetical protein ACFCGT_03610 [Sandaracinaceae bacterium]
MTRPSDPTPESCRHLVLVVDDDLPVAERIADALEAAGFDVQHTQDYDLAYLACFSLRPSVLVLDQIVATPGGERLLRRLDKLPGAPPVLVLRFAPGPYGAFARLRVAVLGGRGWFEELPEVVRRLDPTSALGPS